MGLRHLLAPLAVVAAVVTFVALGAPSGVPDAAAAKHCGKAYLRYSYATYSMKVVVARGAVGCLRAKRVMRAGIPATRNDPRGWRCRTAPRGRRYTDVCKSIRAPRREIRATVNFH